jgi:uncharacterized damage-inducible protein DinB
MWANETWIRFIAANCPSDEYLLKRISHILLGEEAWFQRLSGEEPDRDIWKVMAISGLLELQGEHRGVYANLLGGDLDRIIAYRRFTGEVYQSPVADILLHLVLHGAHHRGQMSTDASAKGMKPTNTDFVQFCLVHGL